MFDMFGVMGILHAENWWFCMLLINTSVLGGGQAGIDFHILSPNELPGVTFSFFLYVFPKLLTK